MRVTIQHGLKVPAEQEYSSRQHSVAVDLEVPEDVVSKGKDAIRGYVAAVAKEVRSYVEEALTNERIERQEREPAPERIQSRPAPSASPSPRAPGRMIRAGAPQNGRAAPRGDDALASPKQVNFLRSLGSQNGLSYGQVSALAQETFGKRDLRELTKKEASSLIDQLRSEAA